MNLRSWRTYSLKAEKQPIKELEPYLCTCPNTFLSLTHHLVYINGPLNREYITPIWPEDQVTSIPNYGHFLINKLENLLINVQKSQKLPNGHSVIHTPKNLFDIYTWVSKRHLKFKISKIQLWIFPLYLVPSLIFSLSVVADLPAH